MKGDRYKKVIEEKLVPFMRIHKTNFFLQDGAPCHKSKKVLAALKGYKEEFSVLDWSGNSTCSVSRWRPQKVDKRMYLDYTHGLFIT
jgi:hypothetical protein